jgi:uncharacterized membrane protein
MRLSLSNLIEYAESRLWVMPTAFLLAVLVLSQAILAVDRHADLPDDSWFLFPGGPEGARDLLSTVATVTFTFTALVFSITMVVLQLAASQLSPRVMRLFLRDTGTQVVLATFLASFAYSMLVLREVRSGDDPFVPALAIWIAFAFVVVDIALFIFYINHMTQRIRAGSVTWEIGNETLATINREYPDPYEGIAAVRVEPATAAIVVPNSRRGGSITYVDRHALRSAARDHGLIIKVLPAAGDFVPTGGNLLKVWPHEPHETGPQKLQHLEHHISHNKERTLQQDVGFGLRQLVDIAERALSPGTNDPTTAVQALDQIHEILVCLSGRAIPAEEESTDPFLITNEPTWDDFISMGLDEVRLYGKGSLQITRRIRNIIETLLAIAPPARHGALHRQLQLIDEAIPRDFDSPLDRETASHGSAQGAGPRN